MLSIDSSGFAENPSPRGSKYPTFDIPGSKNPYKGMVFGTRNFKYWVLGPSGLGAMRGPKGDIRPS